MRIRHIVRPFSHVLDTTSTATRIQNAWNVHPVFSPRNWPLLYKEISFQEPIFVVEWERRIAWHSNESLTIQIHTNRYKSTEKQYLRNASCSPSVGDRHFQLPLLVQTCRVESNRPSFQASRRRYCRCSHRKGVMRTLG